MTDRETKLIVVGGPSDRMAIADAALRSRKRYVTRKCGGLRHHGIRGGVDEAESTAGDDLAVDLASAALEMSLPEGRAEQAPPTVSPTGLRGRLKTLT